MEIVKKMLMLAQNALTLSLMKADGCRAGDFRPSKCSQNGLEVDAMSQKNGNQVIQL